MPSWPLRIHQPRSEKVWERYCWAGAIPLTGVVLVLLAIPIWTNMILRLPALSFLAVYFVGVFFVGVFSGRWVVRFLAAGREDRSGKTHRAVSRA